MKESLYIGQAWVPVWNVCLLYWWAVDVISVVWWWHLLMMAAITTTSRLPSWRLDLDEAEPAQTSSLQSSLLPQFWAWTSFQFVRRFNPVWWVIELASGVMKDHESYITVCPKGKMLAVVLNGYWLHIPSIRILFWCGCGGGTTLWSGRKLLPLSLYTFEFVWAARSGGMLPIRTIGQNEFTIDKGNPLGIHCHNKSLPMLFHVQRQWEEAYTYVITLYL